jgi:PAS domain S-box-containing protein
VTQGDAQVDAYNDLLAELESLAPDGAASILSSLASAIFPAGFGDLRQVTWEQDTGASPPSPTTPGDVAEQRTVEKLRAAELRYRTLVEQIPAVTFMAVLGEGENEVYVSPHIEALLGFTQKEWLENPFLWYTQLHPDDRALWHAEFARGCRTGGPFQAECRFIARDGRVVWVRGEARLVKDELGRPLFLQGVAFDITESKQAQAMVLRQAISTTEDRYRALVEQTGAIFWEAEMDTPGFTFVSRGAERILGFPIERWVDDPAFWISRVHPDDRQRVQHEWGEAHQQLTGGGDFEFRAIAADGRTVWLHQKVYIDRLASNKTKIIGVILDVTDRKRIEQILLDETVRLETETDIRRTLHRIGTELTSQLTVERVVQLATDEAAALTKAEWGALFYRVPSDQDEGPARFAVSGVPRETLERLDMAEGEAPTREVLGRQLSVRDYLSVPVVSRSGQVLGRMFFGHSQAGVFTEEHERLAAGIAGWTALAIDNARLYSAAEVARTAAEGANRAKDEFLATMSHELRTPLNAVLGWIQILRAGAGSKQNRERGLAIIERNARAQAQIIDDLLDVSRIVTGKLDLNVQPVDLVTVIDASLEAVSLAVGAKQLVVVKDMDPAAAIVSGDRDRLRQVVSNILTNAVKFTPQGGRISVLLKPLGDAAQLRVADTGQGIDPRFLPHVFDRFWQGDSSSTRLHGGLGLGLAIVRHIVEMHGGTVSVESAGLGKGATFIVELPLSVTASDTVCTREALGDAPEVLAPLNEAHVLVVDDEADSSELMASLFCSAGAIVSTAASVAEALRSIHKQTPELIVSDVGMPYADGYALLRELRAMGEPYASIPVVAVTAYARVEDRQRALAAGFRTHVGKPYESDDLLRMAADVISKARA